MKLIEKSKRLSPHRLFVIGAAGSVAILITALAVTAGVVTHINNRSHDEASENKAFMDYVAQHNCKRWNPVMFFSDPSYHCDNGAWSESDLIKVIHGRYPNG